MKKLRDLAWALGKYFFTWYLAFLLMLALIAAIGRAKGSDSLTLSVALLYAAGAALFVMAVGVLPRFIIDSRTRHGDPFQFTRYLKAYFLVPSRDDSDIRAAVAPLRDVLFRFERSGTDRWQAQWRKDRVAQSAFVRSGGWVINDRWIYIAAKCLSDSAYFVEVTIEPTYILTFYDYRKANLRALDEIMVTLGWKELRVPVDSSGSPVLPGGAIVKK